MTGPSASSSREGPAARVGQWPAWALAATLLLGAAACGRDSGPLMPAPSDGVVMVTPSSVALAVDERVRLVARTSCIGRGDEGLTWIVRDTSVAAVVEFHDSAGLGIAVVAGRGEGSTVIHAIARADPTRGAGAAVQVFPWALEP